MVVVDNYDSFTYNLCQVRGTAGTHGAGSGAGQPGGSSVCCRRLPFSSLRCSFRCPTLLSSFPTILPHHAVPQYLGDLGCEYVVFPNDAKTVEEIRAMNPRGILVSPGPGERVCGHRGREACVYYNEVGRGRQGEGGAT